MVDAAMAKLLGGVSESAPFDRSTSRGDLWAAVIAVTTARIKALCV